MAAPEPDPKPARPDARPAEQASRLVFDDPLDGRGFEDTDEAWGERGEHASDVRRFLADKPPHHL